MNQIYEKIRPFLKETPLTLDENLSKLGKVYLKEEQKQHTGSYKVRGALSALSLTDSNKVVCASAGNHSQGIGYASRLLRKNAVVFLPETVNRNKLEKTKSLGVEVFVGGKDFDEANELGELYASKHNLPFIHPFDNLNVIKGQGTIGLECGNPDYVVVPVGGGGLLAGIGLALPKTTLFGVEPEEAASFSHALEKGRPSNIETVMTCADGCAVKKVGKLPFKILKDRVNMITVNETEIKEAMNYLWNKGIYAEPAGALSVAGLKKICHKGKGVCIVSGGNFN